MICKKKSLKGILLALIFASIPLQVLFAQINEISIVGTYIISDQNYDDGDIVVYDVVADVYSLARGDTDKDIFGVIQENPVVVFRVNAEQVPVANSGEAFVNVTTLNGSIQVGDSITMSEIPGKGQVLKDGGGVSIGIALENFTGDEDGSGVITFQGKEFASGQILILLNVGSNLNQQFDKSAPILIVNEGPTSGLTIGTSFRYILATVFAIGSLFLVFKNFGPSVREGVISVGRNPLARSTIQSMVTFNMLLILAISVAILLISLAIILVPLR